MNELSIALPEIHAEFELSGFCPVQGFGVVHEHELYFRAKNHEWSFEIADSEGRLPSDFPTESRGFVRVGTYTNASWMPLDKAVSLIKQCLYEYKSSANESTLAGLEDRWSPEQIARTLRLEHPLEPEHRVSHETIYTTIYARPKGELRKELIACLRQGRSTRKRRSAGEDRRGKLVTRLVLLAKMPDATAASALAAFTAQLRSIAKPIMRQILTP